MRPGPYAARMRPDFEFDFESDFEAELESDLESDFESDLESDFESGFESDFESDSEPGFESEFRSDFESDFESSRAAAQNDASPRPRAVSGVRPWPRAALGRPRVGHCSTVTGLGTIPKRFGVWF